MEWNDDGGVIDGRRRGGRNRRRVGWRGLRREEILIREKWLGSPNLIPMP